MLKEKEIKKQLSLVDLNSIREIFSISFSQGVMLQKFVKEIINYNKHTNLVGKSTLNNPWRSHILDCIQITSFVGNKNSTILDMGTGAGLPGMVLAIMGYKKVSVIDSSGKKISFIKYICSKLDIKLGVFLGRIEKLKNKQYDFLTSRALANLNKLFAYSYNFLNRDTVLIFLKGKTVNDEIKEVVHFCQKMPAHLQPS